MRHILTRELGKIAAEQQPRQLPLPVVCSWYLEDRITAVELCWNPRHAQRMFREEASCGLLLGVATAGPSRKIQIRRAVRAAGVCSELPESHLFGADINPPAGSPVPQLDDSEERVVGHFRILQGGPADTSGPTKEDERIVQECCSSPPGVVLLLHWRGDHPAGALYLWDEAGLQAASSMLLPLTAIGVPPAVPFIPASTAPAALPLNRKSLVAGILCGAFLATVAMISFNLLRQSGIASTAPGADLPVLVRPAAAAVGNIASLRMEAVGGLLQIRWDPSSPEIQSSDSAHVAIVDGAQLKTILLSGNQLRTGLLLYSPEHANVTVSLVGVKDGNTAFKSVISVGALPAQTVPVATAAAAPPSFQTPPEPTLTSVRQSEPAPAATPDPVVSPPPLAPEKPVPPAPAPAETEPPVRTAQLVKPAPPERLPEPAIVPNASPEIRQAAPPVATQSSFTPARPRHPILLPPADAFRRLLVTSVTIPVTVQIGSSGKVTSVAADTPDNLSGALASLAMAAVKNHPFEPARRDGVPVPSQLVVMFTFTRK